MQSSVWKETGETEDFLQATLAAAKPRNGKRLAIHRLHLAIA